MTLPSLETIRDLAPGYLLRTLSDVERAQFERALRDPELGPVLEVELSALRDAFGALAEGEAVQPPADLRARVIARVQSEAESTPPTAPRVPHEGAARPPRVRWMPAALVAAMAASAVFAIDRQRVVGRLEAELAAQRSQLDSTRAQLSEQNSTLKTLTDGGNELVLVRLTPNTQSGPALQVFWNPRSGKAVIHASGLAPIAADRAYCLWVIRNGTPVPLALFRPGADGSRLLNDVTVATGTAGVAAFAVTEEDAAGSPVPTMTPFLVGAVKAE